MRQAKHTAMRKLRASGVPQSKLCSTRVPFNMKAGSAGREEHLQE